MTPKPVVWVASSRRDLRLFPGEVRTAVGVALYQAQIGRQSHIAKPLKGFRGAGVLEIVSDFDGNTFRAVYTVRLRSAVYVLHAFQKKSRSGIATPKHEIDLIAARLRQAEAIERERIRDEANDPRP